MSVLRLRYVNVLEKVPLAALLQETHRGSSTAHQLGYILGYIRIPGYSDHGWPPRMQTVLEKEGSKVAADINNENVKLSIPVNS